MHSVVITGMGIVSCLGTGKKKVKRSLKECKSGIQFVPERKELGFRSALSGIITDFEIPLISRKQRKTMPEFVQQGYAAALEAIEQAGLNEDEIRSERTALIIGNDSAALANYQQAALTLQEKRTFPLGGSLVFHALTSTITINLNTLLGNLGASWTLSGACASGGHAIGQAADLITQGRQDRAICGGVQEINWESVAAFDATNAFSIRQDEPEKASRPFDADRDGLVPSGGAAIVCLEREDLARKRGAQILAKLKSYAFSSDGRYLAVPTGEGLERCIRECLKRGATGIEEVDYICAHATSTPVGDKVEATAIRGVFNDKSPWVSSMKSYVGHEMWMAGAAQVVYSILMAQSDFIAPNLNFEKQEEDAPPLRIASEIISIRLKYVLCNSAGFGGTNSCLLLEITH